MYMTITTLVLLATLTPLAFSLALALVGSRNSGQLPYPSMTRAEFDEAFDLYVEARNQQQEGI